MKIVFDNVSKNFGVIDALKNVSFEIQDGEFVFLVGPSGAGKSTILKLILSQYRPSSGTINIGDYELSKSKKGVEALRKKIGVIFQDYQLIADKTIEENIALALDIVGYPHASIASRTDEVIKKVNLNSRRFLFPSQLSGGELQRAALARALAVEPKIILADEPTGNLDPENSWHLLKLLKDISESSKTTIIMTTHNTDFIDSLSKRVITLKSGQVVSDNQYNSSKKIKK